MKIKKYFLVLLVSVSVFSMMAFGQDAQKREDEVLNTYIQKTVSKELEKQILEDALVDKRPLSRKKDIYLLPNLPFYTTYFNKRDFVQIIASFDDASQAYASNGGSQDLSKLWFGQDPILIQNVVLASKLASDGKLGSLYPLTTPDLVKKSHYMSILADQELVFDASLQTLNLAAHYARHFKKGDITIGLYIPFKVRWQHLYLTNDLDPAIQQKLKLVEKGYCPCDPSSNIPGLAQNSELQFFKKYNNLRQFVDDMFTQKEIVFDEKATVGGLSDIVLYGNIDIQSRHFSRFVTGVSVLIPTAQEQDANKLWDSPLGNGGSVEASLFLTMVWETWRWWNPYVQTKGTYAFPVRQNRRVPHYITHDGITGKGQPASTKMLMGNTLILGPLTPTDVPADFAFSELDSTVRGFADGVKKIRINTGAQFVCRVGNTVARAFSKKGLLDLFYEFWLKGSDYLSHKQDNVGYDPSLWKNNTDAIKHTVGLAYSYQFDASYRLHIGGSYVFAGRNTPKQLACELSLNMDF